MSVATRAIRVVEYAGQSARGREGAQISNRDLLVGLVMEKNGLAHSILADKGDRHRCRVGRLSSVFARQSLRQN
jgi:hypothetical protein